MPPSGSVEALRDALSDPAVYPHDPERVDLVQTHISLVALVPPWVYKVKKPLDLGFLDFATLAARKDACDAEVRLNQRLCTDVYQAVVPIVDTPDGLRVDPPGGLAEDTPGDAVVEYAVKMRYLNPEGFLHNRLADGDVTPATLDRVANTLADFYAERTSTPAIAEEGWIERLRVSTDENFEQTEALVGDVLPRPTYDALRRYTDRFYTRHAALLHRRRAGGSFIDGHGDLRLEHIHCTADRLCIYDCIEFNERFRYLDVANDVAFLAMDLDVQGRPDLSRHFVARMQEVLDDPDLATLLPFYKSYRAYVRGKVEGMRAAEDEVPASERLKSQAQARRFYQWALRYAVCGPDPLVIVVMGRSGTGKSTQASALARCLGWTHVSSDRVRKTRAEVPLHIRPDATTRERLYSAEMTAATYATLRERAVARARQHQSTVLDATFSRFDARERLRAALKAEAVPYVFVELTADDSTLRNRLSKRTGEATVSDAREEDFEMLSQRYQAPDALEDARHVRIPTDDGVEATTTAILDALIALSGR